MPNNPHLRPHHHCLTPPHINLHPQVWRTMWRDFGGGREAADADSAATAAREFAEETLVGGGGGGPWRCARHMAPAAAVSVVPTRLPGCRVSNPTAHHPSATQGLFGACGVDQRAVEAAAAVAEARLRDPHLALKVGARDLLGRRSDGWAGGLVQAAWGQWTAEWQ